MEGMPASLSGGAKLKTIDCVAQSLAVGPIFSAAAVGGALAALSGGVGPFVTIITAIGIFGLGRVVSDLAKRFSGSGTVYEWVAHTLGKRAAVFTAGAYHFAVIALGSVGIAIIVGISLNGFFNAHMSIDVAWWVWSIIAEAIILTLIVLGVQISVRTQLTVLGLSLIPFLIVCIWVIAKGGANGNTLNGFNPGKIADGGSIFTGLIFAILLFVGFELAAALGEETENPKHSIPRAVLVTIGLVTGFYLLTQYVGNIGFGADKIGDWQAAGPGGFSLLAETFVNHPIAVLVELAIILDMFAVGIGFQLAAARGLFTLARDGLLPASLTRVTKRNTPGVASAVVAAVGVLGVLVTLIKYKTTIDETVGPLALNGFLIASTIGAMVICLCYVLVCLGWFKLFGVSSPVGVVAALLGLVTCALGVFAQFYSKTAPVGDAKWGVWIGLVGIVLVAAWVLASKKANVDRAGQHTVHHTV